VIGRRRAGRSDERLTLALGVVALGATVGAAVVEYGRVWRRGSAPALADTNEPLLAAAEAAVETAAVARSGYREGSISENAMFNLLSAFVGTFVAARGVTTILRGRQRVGPLRNLKLGRRHIHHFVPGILLTFVSGTGAIVTRDEALDRRLALCFGAGMGLTMDESALLLELDDVYWTEEGIVSVQIVCAVTALLASLAIATRFLLRGEHVVLASPGNAPRVATAPPTG